jgi:exopolyphosphatase/guanosine-5'-triphosphate,3'-diphosphate pyrophosphatase
MPVYSPRVRIAIIDLGTNSIRFGVHELSPRGTARQLYREKLMIRLGQNVFSGGGLDPQAVRRAIHALRRFREIATEFKVERIIAFGTSALRDSRNAAQFVENVQSKTGIDLRIISGEEEARLIALGVLSNEKPLPKTFALIDIGGGSTEISVCRGKEALFSKSYPLGTARIQQLFLRNTPPHPKQVKDLRRFIRSSLETDSAERAKFLRGKSIAIGSSGTIRALSRLARKAFGAQELDLTTLSRINSTLSRLTASKIAKLPGMEPKRVDMILAGSILLEETLKFLNSYKVNPTQFSLRDGILEEERILFKEKRRSHLSIHVPDLYQTASRFGISKAISPSWVKLSELLFDRLAPVHNLKPHWKIYLSTASLLRSTGKVINLAHFPTHSYYIASHLDLPVAETWEQEFVAKLCLLHQQVGLARKKLPFPMGSKRADAFRKLLALLSIVDALDRGQGKAPVLKRCRISRSTILLTLPERSSSGLEVITLMKRESLYYSAFRRKVEIHFI